MANRPDAALSGERELTPAPAPAPAPADPEETETMDDDALAFAIMCHAWDEYLITQGPGNITDYMRRFASCYNIPETCKAVKIFGFFEAGMSAGIDLAIKLQRE